MKTGTIFDIGVPSMTTVSGRPSFKGCPLRCRWCHNPEGLSVQPQLMFAAAHASAAACMEVCPAASSQPALAGKDCIACGTASMYVPWG
ncbi:MAG: hypothetical protein ACLUOI_34950 [Eisenbergiella sp.]